MAAKGGTATVAAEVVGRERENIYGGAMVKVRRNAL